MTKTNLTIARPLMSMAALTLSCLMASTSAMAQTTGGPNNPAPTVTDPRGNVPGAEAVAPAPSVQTLTMPVTSAVQSATTLAREPLSLAINRALPAEVVRGSQLMMAAAALPSVSATAPMVSVPVRAAVPVLPAPPKVRAEPMPLSPSVTAGGVRPSLPLAPVKPAAPLEAAPTAAPMSGPLAASPAAQPVTVGAHMGEGVRVMRAPAACTPKTNSLDCVQDSSEAGHGANVSGRVRNSVIGEVGAGKATTEGAGGAQRQQACTPKPGELSCSN